MSTCVIVTGFVLGVWAVEIDIVGDVIVSGVDCEGWGGWVNV